MWNLSGSRNNKNWNEFFAWCLCWMWNLQGQKIQQGNSGCLLQGKNISDVLDMSVIEAYEFLKNIPSLERKLKVLIDVGLDYIKLGQLATTLSGGEAQRIKLATELSKTSRGKSVYILDEPTTGLHFQDVQKNYLRYLID